MPYKLSKFYFIFKKYSKRSYGRLNKKQQVFLATTPLLYALVPGQWQYICGVLHFYANSRIEDTNQQQIAKKDGHQ